VVTTCTACFLAFKKSSFFPQSVFSMILTINNKEKVSLCEGGAVFSVSYNLFLMHINEVNFKLQSVHTVKHYLVFIVNVHIVPFFCASSLEIGVSSADGILLGAVTKNSSACCFKAFLRAPSFCLKTSPLWRYPWRHKICKKKNPQLHSH
jgi:hypothetical protein